MGDDPHHDRVQKAVHKILTTLEGLENDPEIFPDGPPADPHERVRKIGLLGADAMAGTCALIYIGLFKEHGAEAAREWLTQFLAVFQPTVERELHESGTEIHVFDWKKMLEDANKLWDFSGEVPDSLPEDF